MEGQTITARLWQRIARHLESRIGDRARAEDCLKSAWVKMREYQQQHVVGCEEAFLKRTALNLAVDERRSARVRYAAPICISEMTDIRHTGQLSDEVMLVQERLEDVRARLMRLAPRTREIFLMHRLDGLKHREIAERLCISVSAVEKQIAKAVLAISRLDRS